MAMKQTVWSGLSARELREAYEVALMTRASIITCMTMKSRGEGVEFWIGGPGEEVHGTATAIALDQVLHEEQEEPHELAWFCHYRSDAIAAMTAKLRGYDSFVMDYFRQSLSRVTDPSSGGRQMVMHLCLPELGIWPMQSPVGMQLSKAAGYARGLQIKGQKGLAVGIVGDGTTGESDFHEAAMAAAIWKLPLLLIVTDNQVAITVTPEDGRGIQSYRGYAEAFGLSYFECDGHDFMDTYEKTADAARHVLRSGEAGLMVARVPRLMGHSSSSGGQFDLDARDPLLEFGAWLSGEGIVEDGSVFRREVVDRRKSYFEMHHLGEVMHQRLDEIRKVVFEVRQEPAPSVEAGDVWRHSYPPFPEVSEPTCPERKTRVQYNEALNLALHRIFEDGGATGKGAAMWGQDVGHRGGIFQVSTGLKERFPEFIRDAPINEPMILGTAVGAALHQDLTLLPEIQFGDYTLNCLHWLVHLGNLYWSSNGQAAANVTLRTPVDPVSGGAIYHSMSVDGFYGSVPGLVITMPSTAYDAYGLLRTAADYRGPVLQLEPKRMYRLRLGHAMPGEPEDGKTLQNLRRAGERFPIDDYRIPIGSACQRRAGSDVTILSWGWAVWQSVEAADALAESHGIDAEVIDLRTLVPYDRELIYEAAQRTGRVIIAQNDRTFAGFGRQIQGDLIEAYPGISVRVIGQLNTPAVAQSRVLEDAITLQVSDIKQALVEMVESKPQAWLENELHWLAHAPSRKTR